MRKLMLVCALVLMTGCSVPWQGSTKQVEVWPVLPVPERVVLELPDKVEDATVDGLLDSLYSTIEYAQQLEVTIEVYNANAVKHNAEVRSNLGIAP